MKKVKEKVKHLCHYCKRPVDKKFAVELEDGYAHQSCFRRG